MLELLRKEIAKKDILILGYGREGRSSLQRIWQVKGFASVTIADQNPVSLEAEYQSVPILSGPSYMDTLDDYDLIFKSPGIVLPKEPEEYNCLFTSQMEIFMKAYREQMIGITGTKGKSTVTTMLYHILKESKRDVVLAGNIGIPAFDILEDIGPKTFVICELSCHQLEYIHVSPRIAMLLNIHEEHLDHYGTMKKYIHSKQQIYLHQGPKDLLLCDLSILPHKSFCAAHIYTISDCFTTADVVLSGTRIRFEQGEYKIPAKEIHLLGHHNHIDIAFDYAVCHLLGLSDEEFDAALRTYQPLPHRLHFIGEKDQIRYYDDSISTICDTAIQALHSVEDADTILIGGMDRGIDYEELIRALYRYPKLHVILMEATGRRIDQEIRADYQDFPNPGRLYLTEHLEDAVKLAAEKTRPGRSCVLSPAAASYGIFKNFEERGEAFQELVKNGV